MSATGRFFLLFALLCAVSHGIIHCDEAEDKERAVIDQANIIARAPGKTDREVEKNILQLFKKEYPCFSKAKAEYLSAVVIEGILREFIGFNYRYCRNAKIVVQEWSELTSSPEYLNASMRGRLEMERKAYEHFDEAYLDLDGGCAEESLRQ